MDEKGKNLMVPEIKYCTRSENTKKLQWTPVSGSLKLNMDARFIVDTNKASLGGSVMIRRGHVVLSAWCTTVFCTLAC